MENSSKSYLTKVNKRGIIVEGIVESFSGPYHSVEITKNTKGYNWTIKVTDKDIDYIKGKLEDLNAYCKEKFDTQE